MSIDINMLLELCRMPGVSGDEGAVRGYIADRCRGRADSVETDVMGNLIVYKKGRSQEKKVMVCAHMDEVGLIVTRVTGDGYLKFDTVGGIDPRLLPGRRLICGAGRLGGVIGAKPKHLTSPKERETVVKTDDMVIDIGALNKEQAEAGISPGDYAAFYSEGFLFGEDMVCAKALDDRAGCAVMLSLLDETPRFDTWFVFTVQEEVGTRGSAVAAYAIEPDECLVIEGTTAADHPPSQPHTEVCRVGGGPVIPFMDKGCIYDRRMCAVLKACAGGLGLRWQTKELIAGGTDAGKVQLSKGGVACAAVSVPVRYIHSANSAAELDDIEGVRRLCAEYIKDHV